MNNPWESDLFRHEVFELMKSIGCKDIGITNNPHSNLAHATASYGGREVVFRASVHHLWGSNETIGDSDSWSDRQFPMTTFPLPLPIHGEPAAKFTHHLCLGSDLKRAIIVADSTVSSTEDRTTRWVDEGEEQSLVHDANILRYAPKLMFFYKTDTSWSNDKMNSWKKPASVPMDINEYLESLSK
jgi:hypothetical protein